MKQLVFKVSSIPTVIGVMDITEKNIHCLENSLSMSGGKCFFSCLVDVKYYLSNKCDNNKETWHKLVDNFDVSQYTEINEQISKLAHCHEDFMFEFRFHKLLKSNYDLDNMKNDCSTFKSAHSDKFSRSFLKDMRAFV